MDDGDLVEVLHSVCLWNKTWSLTEFPPCRFIECVVPPSPPADSGLIVLEDENDFFLEAASSRLFYDQPAPFGMMAPVEFAQGDFILRIDGKMADESPDWTSLMVILTDTVGLEVFRMTLNADNRELTLENGFTPGVKTGRSKVSPGEPFAYSIAFDVGKFEFVAVDSDYEETFFEITPGVAALDSPLTLLVSGSADLNVVGFVENPDDAFPADASMIFGCENDTLDFVNAYVNMALFPVKCNSSSGEFEDVELWPICGTFDYDIDDGNNTANGKSFITNRYSIYSIGANCIHSRIMELILNQFVTPIKINDIKAKFSSLSHSFRVEG